MKSLKFILLSLVLLLSACSRIDLAFRFADTALWWKIDEYFDFQNPRKLAAKKATEKIVHDFFVNNSKEACADLSQLKKSRNIVAYSESFLKLTEKVIEQQRSSFHAIVDQVDKHEYEYLVKTYKDKILTQEKLLHDKAALYLKMQEGYSDFIEFMLGNLSSAQEQMIHDFFQLNHYPVDADVAQKYTFLDAIEKTGGNQSQLKILSDDFWAPKPKLGNVNFLNQRQIYSEALVQLSQKILNTLSPKQQEKFEHRIDDLIASFQKWAQLYQ